MKQIKLTKGMVVLVDDEDIEFNKKRIYLGCFANALDAYYKRREAEILYYAI